MSPHPMPALFKNILCDINHAEWIFTYFRAFLRICGSEINLMINLRVTCDTDKDEGVPFIL